MNEKPEKYQLYVGHLQDIPDYAEFSYYDSTKRRLFLLCDRRPDGKFAPVPHELWGELTPDESKWLRESCREINRRWMEAHQNEAAETANAFLDLFEKELKKEVRNAKEIKDGDETSESDGAEKAAH